MSVEVPDHDWTHLWPDFRAKLQLAFVHCAKAGFQMHMFEGYRSVERQLWLYAQGRTRPGPKVTAMKFPKMHGKGLAADCYPLKAGKVVFAFSDHELHIWREGMSLHGLKPTAFRGDLGHAELDCDSMTQGKAAAWVAKGFRE